MNTSARRSSARLTILVCLLGIVPSIAHAQTLPAGWTSGDVGSPAIRGSASSDGATFTVSGAGADVWGAADQFHYVHRPLTGDGTIVARVAAIEAADAWTKAGVMMRESLAAGSRHAFALVSPTKGLAFQRRTSTSGATSHTSATGAPPAWVKLERSGSTFTASHSSDGRTWKTIASQTIAMPATIHVGLAVTSHRASTLARATFSDVSAPAGALPEGWTSSDVGAATRPGTAAHESGVFTIEGAGRDIWGTVDEFRYTYVQASGDVDVVARVDSVEAVDAWTKAGVMLRGSLAPSSAHATMLVSPAKGLAFQRRRSSGATTTHTSGGSGKAPRWVKLSRRGQVVTAYQSDTGASWTEVGADTIALPSTFYAGLAVTSHDGDSLATAVFSSVGVQAVSSPATPAPPNQPPTVSLTSPAAGSSYVAGTPVPLAATAADSDGSISRVDFYAGATLLASDASAPYSYAWSGVAAGTYSITAVAVDNAGLMSKSQAQSVTVSAAPASATGLLVHWRLDDASGTRAADALGRHHGTLTNGAGWTSGRSGGGVRLDGVNDYVALPNLDVAASAITVAAWVKSEALGEQRIVSKSTGTAEQDHYWMLSQYDNRLRFRLKAGGTTTTLVASSGSIPLNTWYHAAATYDGSVMRLYLNGVQVGSVAKSGPLALSGAVPVSLGRSPDGASYTHLKGTLDDVRIYERALGAAEIQDLNGNTTSAPDSPPTVSMSAPSAGTTLLAPASMTVSASASDADGAVTRVEFYAGSTLIGTDTTTPYAVTWTGVAPGAYSLTAKAWDDAGGWSVSPSRSVTVASQQVANQSPYVALTAPAAGATLTAPAALTLAANASDADGTIARVEFYSGSQLLATDTTAPYSFAWSNVPAGSYSLTAVARDSAGATTVSSAVGVTVSAPNMPSVAVFAPSSNHTTAVDRYILEFFYAGADPKVSNAVSTADLGKPAVVNGEIQADVSQVITTLTPGAYIATVTAVGSGGSARSAASQQFLR